MADQPVLVLYHLPFSRSSRVQWLLKELGMKVEIIKPDLNGLSTLPNPDLLAVNPSGRVPALRDGDACVSQSGACILYILEKYGGGKFQPAISDSKGRATFLRHMFAAEDDLTEPAIKVWLHGSKLPEEERIPQVLDMSKKTVLNFLDLLEEEMNGKKYLVNDKFSAADIMVGLGLLLCMSVGLLDDQKHKNITSYFVNLKERPAYKETFQRDST